MTNAVSPDVFIGRTAVDPDGNKIGSVGQVYVNDQSGVPDWITVNTGLFGMKENFVPLQGSSFNGDDLVLPFGKDVVKDAPEVAMPAIWTRRAGRPVQLLQPVPERRAEHHRRRHVLAWHGHVQR